MIPVPVMPQTPLAVRPTNTSVAPPIPPPTTSSATAVDTNAAGNAPAGDGPTPAKKARTEDELESEADWLTKVLLYCLGSEVLCFFNSKVHYSKLLIIGG